MQCMRKEQPVHQDENNEAATAFAQSISLNNHGALLIENNDFFNAVKTLKMALLAFRQAVQGGEQQQQQEEEEEEFSTQLQRQQQHAAQTQGDEYAHENHHPSLDDGLRNWTLLSNNNNENNISASSATMESFVYEHPLILTGTEKSYRTNDWLISISIVFNLALAHHRTGLAYYYYSSSSSSSKEARNNETEEDAVQAQQEQGRKLLFRATKFYQTLFPLLQRQEYQQQGNGGGMFTMIVLNNLGQLHQTLHENEISQHYFQQLLSALMYHVVMIIGYHTTNDNMTTTHHHNGILNKQQWDCLFCNTMHMILKNCCHGAGAA